MEEKEKEKSPAQTKMQAPPAKQTKMVKLKALRPLTLRSGETVVENTIFSVPEDEAKELCAKFRGPMNFAGERILQSHEKNFLISRAVPAAS